MSKEKTGTPLAEPSQDPTPMETSPSGSDRQLYKGDESVAAPTAAAPTRTSRWKKLAIIGAIALVVLILAIVLPVYFLVIKKKNSSSNGGGSGVIGDGDLPVEQPNGAITGGDGSTVYTENGSFTYSNKFGGTWYYDPANPFANRECPRSSEFLCFSLTLPQTSFPVGYSKNLPYLVSLLLFLPTIQNFISYHRCR
jgi:hypothetical protein